MLNDMYLTHESIANLLVLDPMAFKYFVRRAFLGHGQVHDVG